MSVPTGPSPLPDDVTRDLPQALPHALPHALRFGHFEIRPAERRLIVDGQPAVLGARAFDVLMVLAERRHQLVSKQALLELVWPGVVVEENSIQVQVSSLRKLLGPQAITTIPGRGYRFTAASNDDGGTPSAASPGAAAATSPTAVPASAQPTLLGRGDDMARLTAWLQQHRLVSIVGAGGVGKTRLAQALLARAQAQDAHGAAWVELAAIRDAANLPGAISAALGLGARGADPVAALVQALRPLPLLLVLDNCEHLQLAVATLVQQLLQACPGLRLLLTSQVPLHAADEQVHRLEGLHVPDGQASVEEALRHAAVALFVERAQAADRRFQLDAGNVAAVVQVCHRLDGMPLPVELAAARVPLLGASGLLAGLDQRLQLLSTRATSLPERQRSLRAALEWSHGLLQAADKAVFRRLAVFAGGFTLDLAQQVLPAPDDALGLDRWTVLDALGELVDRSLLSVNMQDPPRYQLLDTPRSLALELLESSGEASSCRARHARNMAAWFAARDAELLAGHIGMDDWLERLSPEIENGRQAMAWALQHDSAPAIELAPGLLRVLGTTRIPERVALADATEALLTDNMPAELRAAWYQAVGLLVPGRADKRIGRARQGALLYRQLQQPAPLFLSVVSLLSMAEQMPAEEVEALHAERHAIEACQTLPARSQMLACQAEYFYRYCRQQWAEAETALLGQAAWAKRAGHSDAALVALSNLADLALNSGQPEVAEQRGRELLRQYGSQGRRRYAHELARRNLAVSLLLQGKTSEARELATQGLPTATAFVMVGLWGDVLALMAAMQQHPNSAAMLCGFADAAYSLEEATRTDESLMARRLTDERILAALGEAVFDQRRRSGSALDLGSAAALAFAASDSS